MGTFCTIQRPLEPLLATSIETTDHSPRLSPQALRMERLTTQALPTQRYSVMSVPKPQSSEGRASLKIRSGSVLSPSRFEATEPSPRPFARKRAASTSELSSFSCASSTTISFPQDGPDRLMERLYGNNRKFGAGSSKPATLTMAATPLFLFQEALLSRIRLKAGSHQAEFTLGSAAASTSDQRSVLPK